MGYRSDIAIAITKELYVKCQLLQNIPKAILEEEMHEKHGLIGAPMKMKIHL